MNELPFRITLAAEAAGDWRPDISRQRLLRRLQSRTADPRLTWQAPVDWDQAAQALRVSCLAIDGDLGNLSDAAVRELAGAVSSLVPGKEPAVRIVDVAVQLPSTAVTPLDRERWGRYAVVLTVEDATWLQADPSAGQYVSDELKKWRRFENSSFAFDSSSAIMTVEVPMARSAAGAEGEARDALTNLIWAAVKDPGDYRVGTLKAEWLSKD